MIINGCCVLQLTWLVCGIARLCSSVLFIYNRQQFSSWLWSLFVFSLTLIIASIRRDVFIVDVDRCMLIPFVNHLLLCFLLKYMYLINWKQLAWCPKKVLLNWCGRTPANQNICHNYEIPFCYFYVQLILILWYFRFPFLLCTLYLTVYWYNDKNEKYI